MESTCYRNVNDSLCKRESRRLEKMEGPHAQVIVLFYSLFSRSPKSHRSTASLSKRQLLPIRMAGIFPFAACLLIVISWSFKYFANSFVVNISPIKNSVYAYGLKKSVESSGPTTAFSPLRQFSMKPNRIYSVGIELLEDDESYMRSTGTVPENNLMLWNLI